MHIHRRIAVAVIGVSLAVSARAETIELTTTCTGGRTCALARISKTDLARDGFLSTQCLNLYVRVTRGLVHGIFYYWSRPGRLTQLTPQRPWHDSSSRVNATIKNQSAAEPLGDERIYCPVDAVNYDLLPGMYPLVEPQIPDDTFLRIYDRIKLGGAPYILSKMYVNRQGYVYGLVRNANTGSLSIRPLNAFF